MVELNGQFPEGCSINPYAKHPELQHSGKADVSKKVLIVGGGVAGLQAAITAAERGHQVTLVEQSSRLGGILNYAEEDEQKGDLYQFARTLECTARNRGVDLRVNTPFTPALLQQLAPDTVIAAVGSSPLVPNIPGLDGPQVQQAEDCYGATPPAGQQVVVMGGGLVGCETAVHLAQHGKQVSLVELRGEVAPDAYRLHKHQLRDLVSELVTTYLNTTCVAVEPEGVRVQIADGTQRLLPADLVVSALGRKANATAEIAAACQTQGIPCTAIGDCVAPRKIFDAVEEGFLTAFQL
jgi:NADPH-dependent 2,4-dienoyl-CoA reductase/sulfur reductase-like enzyme